MHMLRDRQETYPRLEAAGQAALVLLQAIRTPLYSEWEVNRNIAETLLKEDGEDSVIGNWIKSGPVALQGSAKTPVYHLHMLNGVL